MEFAGILAFYRVFKINLIFIYSDISVLQKGYILILTDRFKDTILWREKKT